MTDITGTLVGMRHHPPALAVLSVLPSGCLVTVRPEPHNEHDRNALAVWLQLEAIPATALPTLAERLPGYGETLEGLLQGGNQEIKLGYIAREEAGAIAARLQGPTNGHLSFSGGYSPRIIITDQSD